MELSRRIPESDWKRCSWVTAGEQTRSTQLAWRPVFQSMACAMPGQIEKGLAGGGLARRRPEPYHYYLAHLHRPVTQARCLKLSRSRWHIEQYFQRSNDALGLDHFEGRSWRGFHHHLMLSAVAYLFILTVYLRRKKTFGVTWEQILHLIPPWQVRSTGRCFACRAKFKRIYNDIS